MMFGVCKCSFCKKPKWLTDQQFILEVAKFLGYPKCCTKQFIRDIENIGTVINMRRVNISQMCNNSRFYPCDKHAERIIVQKKSIKRIFRKRICSTPFPVASQIEFSNYLKSIKHEYTKVYRRGRVRRNRTSSSREKI